MRECARREKQAVEWPNLKRCDTLYTWSTTRTSSPPARSMRSTTASRGSSPPAVSTQGWRRSRRRAMGCAQEAPDSRAQRRRPLRVKTASVEGSPPAPALAVGPVAW